MKNLSLFISLALTIIFLTMSRQQMISMSLSTQSPAWTRITYMMIHANLIHLLVNIFSMLSLVFITNARLSQFFIAALISTTIPSAIIADTPMCGISALNYALTGLIVMNSKRWAKYMFINILFIVPTFWVLHIAAGVHLYALLMGAIVSFVSTPRFNE